MRPSQAPGRLLVYKHSDGANGSAANTISTRWPAPVGRDQPVLDTLRRANHGIE
ncbi:hypothetical protein J7E80_23315 [Arthrobacter sp. ISL-28]|nr:hypothetical protein [Arthrobacter sp. ISL-28]